jgi:hypothetical protein
MGLSVELNTVQSATRWWKLLNHFKSQFSTLVSFLTLLTSPGWFLFSLMTLLVHFILLIILMQLYNTSLYSCICNDGRQRVYPFWDKSKQVTFRFEIWYMLQHYLLSPYSNVYSYLLEGVFWNFSIVNVDSCWKNLQLYIVAVLVICKMPVCVCVCVDIFVTFMT